MLFTVSRFFLLGFGVLPALPRELDLLRLAEVEAWDEARCRGLFLDFFSSLDRLFFSFSFLLLLLFSSVSDSTDDDVNGEGDLVDQPDLDGLLVGRLFPLQASVVWPESLHLRQ